MRSRPPVLVVTVALLTVVAAALVIDMVVIEPNRLVARHVEIAHGAPGSAPLRVALLSDVDFHGEGRRERRLRELTRAFDPHLVLVAGDLLGGGSSVVKPERIAAALEWVRSLPASHGRFLVPGEEESFHLPRLRKAWSDDSLLLLANRSVTVRIDEGRVELFGADRERAAAPWLLGADGTRTFVESDSRPHRHGLLLATPESQHWGDVEIEFSFQLRTPGAQASLRFAWQADGRPGGSGWRLLRTSRRPTFRLRASFDGNHELSGRLDSGFVPPIRTWCRARVRLTDDGEATRIRARVWPEWAPEPQRWSIDAVDRGPDRRRSGSVGFGAQLGLRRYAGLTVRDREGALLFREDFAGPRPRPDDRRWIQPSRMLHWLRRTADGDSVRLLLGHTPDLALDIRKAGAAAPDLLLTGHTHGGQVRLPWLGALYTATDLGVRYDRGLFDYHGIPLLITAGVGTSVLPVRLLNPPEVVLVTLVPRDAG